MLDIHYGSRTSFISWASRYPRYIAYRASGQHVPLPYGGPQAPPPSERRYSLPSWRWEWPRTRRIDRQLPHGVPI